MISNIEKEFFKAFGIGPKINKTSAVGMSEFELPLIYPEITDRILLELILICDEYTYLIGDCENVEELKKFILEVLIQDREIDLVGGKHGMPANYYTKVRKLFGVEE